MSTFHIRTDADTERGTGIEHHVGRDEPGNGSSYTYVVWRVGGQWFAAFPDFGAASRIGAGHNHADYIQEKMGCSTPDAIEMARIINECQEVS